MKKLKKYLICLLISSCLISTIRPATVQAATGQNGKAGNSNTSDTSIDEVLNGMGVPPGELGMIIAMVETREEASGEVSLTNVPFNEEKGYMLEPGHSYALYVYYLWHGEYNGDDLRDVAAHCVFPQTIAAGESEYFSLYCDNDHRDACSPQQFYSQNADLRLIVGDMVVLGDEIFTSAEEDFAAGDLVSQANHPTATQLWDTGGLKRSVALSNGKKLNGTITYDDTITGVAALMQQAMADGMPRFNGLPMAMTMVCFSTTLDIPPEPEPEPESAGIPIKVIVASIGLAGIILLILFKDTILKNLR